MLQGAAQRDKVARELEGHRETRGDKVARALEGTVKRAILVMSLASTIFLGFSRGGARLHAQQTNAQEPIPPTIRVSTHAWCSSMLW
jgi:hypothetical protein